MGHDSETQEIYPTREFILTEMRRGCMEERALRKYTTYIYINQKSKISLMSNITTRNSNLLAILQRSMNYRLYRTLRDVTSIR